MHTIAAELLCVDCVAPHGPWADLLSFIFNGVDLSDEKIASLKLLDGELAAFEFCVENKHNNGFGHTSGDESP